MQNIFIGGTGRSGTTILAKALAKDRKIYSLPTELRFVTDPDGLIDLKSALVDEWSFYRGDFACERFRSLIKNLSTKYLNNYPNSNFNNVVGSDFLNKWVENFICEFAYDYSVNNWAARATLFTKIITKLIISIKKDFFRITKNNLDTFFNEICKKNDAEFIIDHTPTNILHAAFLKNIYPSLKIINIYRDPRDVISSYATKDWGNRKFEYNVKWVFDIIKRWDEQKEKIEQDDYLEIKFENFVINYEETMNQIYSFIGKKLPSSPPNIDLSKHNIGRWKKTLSASQNKFIIDKYSSYFIKYNFEI